MNNEMMKMGGAEISAGPNATTAVEQSRAIAEVQGAIVMARRFPRDMVAACDRIKNMCCRPSLAEVAVYTYARGGQNISGPSIRLAEAIAQSWGNIKCGVRELEQRNGESTCEAYAWDMETNTMINKEFQVSHIRHTKRGDTLLTDPRDIYELVANNGARRLRACILAVIPGDIIETAVEQCEQTMNASADVTEEGIKKLLATFSKFGVTKEQIETRIQRRIDAIQPAQVVALRKIYASMKDGMSKPEEWFPAVAKIADTDAKAVKPEGLRAALNIDQPKESDSKPEADAIADDIAAVI